MKKSLCKTTNKCLSLLLVAVLGLVLLTPSRGQSEPVSASVTAAAIAAAIKYASDNGVFVCAEHLQACSSLTRCNRTKAALNLAQSGDEGSVAALKEYIQESDNQRHCVRSMMGQSFIDDVLSWGNPPSGGGEVVVAQVEGSCILDPWLGKFLGVHENGQIVMWPRCSTGEKWQIQ